MVDVYGKIEITIPSEDAEGVATVSGAGASIRSNDIAPLAAEFTKYWDEWRPSAEHVFAWFKERTWLKQ